MSSPIMPVRLQEYIENGSYYPRQLLEAGGKLYIVYSDGSIVHVNKTIDLVDAVNSTETTKAATPNAVKQAYDLAALALPKAGGTVSGNITILATPSTSAHLINKGYVDTEIGKINDAMIKEILVNNQAATITNGSVSIVIPDAPVQSISVNGSNVAPDNAGNIAITIPDAPVQSVSVNGTAVSPDASGNINITAVPSAIVSGLSKVATSNKYSDLDGTPTIPSASTTAPLANAASAAVGTSTNYARADHVHPAPTSISGNAGSATNATNDSEGQNIADTYIKDISIDGTTITFTKGDGDTDTITTQDTVYTHPSHNAADSGLYKITVDTLGHVSAVAAVSKSDITALGIPAQDTTYTHPAHDAKTSGLYKVTVDALGHVSAATAVTKEDITALGIPGEDTNTVYTHPTYTSMTSGLYKVTVDGTGHVSAAVAVTKEDITGLGIPAQDTTYTFDTTPTSNSTNGITSGAVYTALSGKADSSHGNHVPATQTASNSVFLRNDNTWQTVTPANIGAAEASHTHTEYSASDHTHTTYMPKAGGTFTGKAYAQANTSYTTYQLRNIALSKSAATPTGNGSILGVYS